MKRRVDQLINLWPTFDSLYVQCVEEDSVIVDGGTVWQLENPFVGIGSFAGFDRPYGNAPGSFADINTLGSGGFLPLDFPMIYWLEQQGYDVTYISGIDTHVGPSSVLTRAKCYLSVGHDEYYTDEMLTHLEEAAEAGMHMVFLCGNSLGFLIELRENGSGVPNRHFTRIPNPTNPVPGNPWIDARARDIMGVLCQAVGACDWNVEEPGHWIYAGTGLSSGDTIPRLVGPEYHGGNGLGAVVDGAVIVARNSDEAVPHRAIVWEEGGRIVFNAGTIYWPLALVVPPGVTAPVLAPAVDARVATITRNVLNRIVAA